jgi:hypothetical protein
MRRYALREYRWTSWQRSHEGVITLFKTIATISLTGHWSLI